MARQPARDPGAATGTPPRPLPAACANCPHPVGVHLAYEGRGDVRGPCKAVYGGACRCKRYVPKEEM